MKVEQMGDCKETPISFVPKEEYYVLLEKN